MAKKYGIFEEVLENYNDYIFHECQKYLCNLGHKKVLESQMGIDLFSSSGYKEYIASVQNNQLVMFSVNEAIRKEQLIASSVLDNSGDLIEYKSFGEEINAAFEKEYGYSFYQLKLFTEGLRECLIYHNKRMISTSFIRKSNGYCCIKKQMVLCTIFMQPFGLKIAWKSAVCHEKTVYEKNLPFLIQYRFIS